MAGDLSQRLPHVEPNVALRPSFQIGVSTAGVKWPREHRAGDVSATFSLRRDRAMVRSGRPFRSTHCCGLFAGSRPRFAGRVVECPALCGNSTCEALVVRGRVTRLIESGSRRTEAARGCPAATRHVGCAALSNGSRSDRSGCTCRRGRSVPGSHGVGVLSTGSRSRQSVVEPRSSPSGCRNDASRRQRTSVEPRSSRRRCRAGRARKPGERGRASVEPVWLS